jgi:hypothetical protein
MLLSGKLGKIASKPFVKIFVVCLNLRNVHFLVGIKSSFLGIRDRLVVFILLSTGLGLVSPSVMFLVRLIDGLQISKNRLVAAKKHSKGFKPDDSRTSRSVPVVF